MGDPETQSFLALMKSDFLDIIYSAINENLESLNIEFSDETCINVVMESEGYPLEYENGYNISIGNVDDKVFIAGDKLESGNLVTSCGRVLPVLGIGNNIEEARYKTYKNVENIIFKEVYFRTDLGIIK